MNFEYFRHTREIDQYRFFQIPKLLITEFEFKALSTDAKLLYGLFLDRTRLSESQNHDWTDENGNIYICYSTEEIMADLYKSKPTVIKIVRELEQIGLIERKKRPNATAIIYVKNFYSIFDKTSKNAENPAETTAITRESKNFTSGSKTSLLPEVKKTDFRKSNKFTSHYNNNYNNKTDLNETDSISLSSDRSIDSKQLFLSVQKELLEERGIPFFYKEDVARMTAAVQLLTNWSEDYYLYDGIDDDSLQEQQDAQQRQSMLDTLNECLVDMMCSNNPMCFSGAMVTYAKVIDAVNSHIKKDKSGKIISLFDFTDSCVNHLVKIVNTRKVESPLSYIKSSIWTYLKSYKVTGNINYTTLKMTQE